MTSHTPGPWKVITAKDMSCVGSDFRSVIGLNGEEIIDMLNDGCASDPSFDYICLSEANARLIAAAPELLEACLSILEITGGSVHWQGDTEKSLKLIEAAVAKATGDAP